MENSLINERWRMAIIPLLLFVVSFLQLNTVNAQKASDGTTDCTENVLGIVDTYIVFGCFRGPDGGLMCTIEQEQCDCALKSFTGAIGCVDGTGKKYTSSSDNGERKSGAASRGGEAESLTVHFLAGESNCLIRSELNNYISRQNNGTLADIDALSKAERKILFWDFKAVESGNDQKGFYILTHEDNPRALVADGTNLNLRSFTQLDQRTKENAKWNFFINDKDSDGVANYQFRPQNNPDNLVLAANSGNNKLVLVDKGGIDNTDTLVTKGGDGTDTPQERKVINWNCQCIF